MLACSTPSSTLESRASTVSASESLRLVVATRAFQVDPGSRLRWSSARESATRDLRVRVGEGGAVRLSVDSDTWIEVADSSAVESLAELGDAVIARHATHERLFIARRDAFEEFVVAPGGSAEVRQTWRIRTSASIRDLRVRDGRIEAVDAEGRVRFATPALVAVDAFGKRLPVTVRASRLAEGFYVTYVPSSVNLPDRRTVAPPLDGVDEAPWTHKRLEHPARLLMQRDGSALIPIATNLPTLVPADVVLEGLRACRGAQENAFKAARAFAHIDRLVDRGVASLEPDQHPVNNPAYPVMRQALADAALVDLPNDAFDDLMEDIATTPRKLPRMLLDPDAQRAVLQTRNRLLLHPLKLATDNSRRWLLEVLDAALAPSDHPDDSDAIARTLLRLLRAPGTLRFDDTTVHVTLSLPLPPKPHARIDAALRALDQRQLRAADGRRMNIRLEPMVTRRTLDERAAAAA
jgi:hypothetical protein